jgi:ABC-2 type transport system ATP-binding protein
MELRGLSRAFGGRTAVDSLTFTVGHGERFGLVGPDGAGKTTTLRMLAGVLSPTAGDALVGGISVVDDPEGVKGEIAYMSQRFGLYTDLTVLENLHFYADLYRVPRGDRPARLERLFEFSGLAPFSDRLAGQLSGGMKQKLGLSCALIHEPEVLLLDEPTFGVDPVSRRELWLIVHEMVSRGVTAVVSTAYLDEAERFDRLALIHHGRVMALDRPEALQRSLPGLQLTVRTAEPRQAREVARGLAGVRHAELFGDRLHLQVDPGQVDPGQIGPGADPEATARRIERELAGAGLAEVAARPATPSLEDVFIQRITEAEAEAGAAATREG